MLAVPVAENVRCQLLVLLLLHILLIDSEVASLLMHGLLQYFISQPPLPPQDVRAKSSGILSSITCKFISTESLTQAMCAHMYNVTMLCVLCLTHSLTIVSYAGLKYI